MRLTVGLIIGLALMSVNSPAFQTPDVEDERPPSFTLGREIPGEIR